MSSGDYKYGIQLLAEQIAEDEHGCDFYSLPDDTQFAVYTRAEQQYWESKAAAAEALNDARV